jgi:hypothetical protein
MFFLLDEVEDIDRNDATRTATVNAENKYRTFPLHSLPPVLS